MTMFEAFVIAFLGAILFMLGLIWVHIREMCSLMFSDRAEQEQEEQQVQLEEIY